MSIEITKGFDEYEVDGYPVRIICIDAPGNLPVLCVLQNGVVYGRYADGTYPHLPPIVKVYPWKSFKVDDPVMVRNFDGGEWHRRHFAGVVDGKPTAFDAGTTLWSSAKEPVVWNQCRYPTEEDL